MPNFSLIEFNFIKNRVARFNNNCSNDKNADFTNENNNNIKLVEPQPTVINLLVDRDRQRLEVVSFILNKIDIILVNTLTDLERNVSHQQLRSKQSKIQKSQINISVKVNFIRNSEIILLYICQAILFADRAILNNASLQKLQTNLVDFKFPIEQSLFIDIIKTLAIGFIYSVGINSKPSVDCLALEVAGYFEMVVNHFSSSVIKL